MKKVLVVAVHPDDETLACGGTLLKHKEQGDQIYWLIVTGLHTDNGFSQNTVDQREIEIQKVSEAYGFAETIRFDFPTMRLDELSYSDLIGAFSKAFKTVEPNVIYLPFHGDVHTDHQVIFNAAYSCTKNFRYPFVEEIYMMETISETDFAPALHQNAFLPNTFVDISPFLDKKLEIMSVFKSEVGEHPFPRSLRNMEALATVRGAQAGVTFAESFMQLKRTVC